MTSISNASWKRKRSKRGMHEYELANGMKLLLVPKEGLKVTTANITYEVGSRMEGLGISGSSHILEHMLFKGSKMFNKPDQWEEFLERNAGSWNAFTTMTSTNYHFDVNNTGFDEALNRFAQFFLAPIFD